jgi:hypothetical protein
MLQALRSNPARQRKAQGKSGPPPVEGWDAISPLASMKPTRAVKLENWFPQPGYVEIRRGYASHATGMGSTTPVQSILIYNALSASNDKMFAVAGTSIYDCTSAGAATDTTKTVTNARWQYVNYTTSAGTAYLWACNGVDKPYQYDSSGGWAQPSITGVTDTDIVNVNVFKKYIWVCLNNSMDAAYLPLDSIAGAATKFPLGSVMGRGGRLMAMATWTRDGGSGADDLAVFISSRGQVAVYQGTNPATDFELVGVYEIPPPIGRRCFTRVAGDIAVVTLGGVLPLSKALTQDTAAEAGIALTLRINNAINAYAQSHKSKFGWELTPFPLGTAAILNIPTAENSSAVQAVMNTLTGAWCKFTGWNMNTFAVFQDNLYGGSNIGILYKMWTGGKDGSSTITATGQTAYNYFGQPGYQKRFTAVQTLITTSQSTNPAHGISTDFKDNAVLGTPSSVTTADAIYDDSGSVYDTALYATDSRADADWHSVFGIGQCASLHFKQSTNTTSAVTVQMNGYNITYELGEFF